MSVRRRPLSMIRRAALAAIVGAALPEAAPASVPGPAAPGKPNPRPVVRERIDVHAQRRVVPTRASAATKTDTPLLLTTESVSVVTRSLMTERQVQTIDEALRYTPGVNADTYGADTRFDWLRIRGFDATTYGLYLDGMRFVPGSTGPVQEQYGLDRIEVLNGPASVLYGQAAPGGLVDMVSKRPQAVPSGEAQFLAGSYARLQGQADLTGPLPGTNGALDGRLVLLARDSDTQVDRVKDNRVYVAPSLAWHITPNDDLTFLSSFQRDHTSGLQFLPAQGTVLGNPNGRLSTSLFTGAPDFDKWDTRQYSVGTLYEHRFNANWRFDQGFRFLHLDLDWDQAYGTGLTPDLAGLTRTDFSERASADLFTTDNRLTGTLRAGPVAQTLVAGLDVTHLDTRAATGSAPGTVLDLFRPVYAPQPAIRRTQISTQDFYQTGLYAQDLIRILGRILVTLGGRYDWTGNDTLTSNPRGQVASSSYDRVFTGKAGLGYLFPGGVMTYASYTSSFQPVTGTDFYGRAFRPTEGKQIEIGAKYQPANMRSFVTGSLFDLRQTNVSQTDPANPLNTIQTGEIHERGAELSATAALGAGVELVAAYTYLDPEFAHSTTGEDGKRPTLIPRNTASLWADWQIDRTTLPALAGIGVGGGVRYVGNQEASDDDSFATPSVTLFDAAIHYDFGKKPRWRLGLNVNNLFDRTYVASCSGLTSCYYGQRRQVLGSLRAAW